jgi:hypothetical protein
MSYSGSNSWVRLLNTDMETHWIGSDDAPKRIGIAWRPDSTLVLGGRFYLAYNDVYKSASENRGSVMMDMTDGSQQLKWNSLTQYDNGAHTTCAGIDLFGGYPGPNEESLRMADVFYWEPADKPTNLYNPLEYRPFADGILSVALKDSNDFEVMERGLCASLYGCTATICTGAGGGNICLGGSGGGEVQCY